MISKFNEDVEGRGVKNALTLISNVIFIDWIFDMVKARGYYKLEYAPCTFGESHASKEVHTRIAERGLLGGHVTVI